MIGVRKISERAAPRVVETRAISQTDLSADDAGIFSGYIAIWDEVDSYNTKFKRGAFKKTFRERAGKIKVLDDHGVLIGRVTDAKEDDRGAWVQGALTMDVQRGAEVRALMRDKAYTALSFGFSTISDKRDSKTGIRDITEVMLYEVSPVIFPANENAAIMSIRSTDFNETVDTKRLKRDGDVIVAALHDTLMDLWYSSNGASDVAAFDLALEAFHAEYLAWVVSMQEHGAESAMMGLRSVANTLAIEMRSAMQGTTPAEIAARTPLTEDQVTTLMRGNLLPIEFRKCLPDISPEVAKAHAELRAELLADTCAELRAGGLSQAEMVRLRALLDIAIPDQPVADVESALPINDIARVLAELRTLAK